MAKQKKAKKVTKPKKKLGLYKKIHLIMSEASKVKKTGFNDYQKYKYSTEEDILSEIRPLLIKYGLIILPSVVEEKIVDGITSLTLAFRIIDTETKEETTLNGVGYGADKQDKGGYKSLTGAVKYFLAKTFLLASGNDPEESSKKAKSIKSNIGAKTISETIQVIRETKSKRTLEIWEEKIKKSEIYTETQRKVILRAIEETLNTIK